MPPKGIVESSQDFKFMWSCLMNAETKPKINWKEVAKEMSLSNAACASARFGQILKKHGFPNKWGTKPGTTAAGVTTKARKTPKTTPTKRKRGKKAGEINEEQDDEEPAVAKKAKTQAEEVDEAAELELYDAPPSASSIKSEDSGTTLGFTPVNEKSNGTVESTILETTGMQLEDEEDEEVLAKIEDLV